jgi:hypothetical protein
MVVPLYREDLTLEVPKLYALLSGDPVNESCLKPNAGVSPRQSFEV